jgi:iron-sulfur cluster assembly protein
MATDMGREDVLTLTGDAADVIASLLREQGYDPDTAGMRISIETGGCAGLTYRFDLRESPEHEDIVCESEQATVFVDPSSEPHVAGAELGVERTAHGTGFCIDNPNATQECGCGISFRTDH